MASRLWHVSLCTILLMLTISWPTHVINAQNDQQKFINVDDVQSDSALVYTYLEAADEAKGAGETQRLRHILGKAQRVADSAAAPRLLQAVEKALGDYYLETTSYDSAQAVLERAVGRSSDIRMQTQLLNLLGVAYRYQSMYPEAMNTYNQALALIDSLEVPNTYMSLTTNKASIYENIGNLSEAISLYQKGISFAEAVGDSSFLATALNNLGNLYFEQSNFEDALSYLKEAIAVSEQQKFYNTLLRAKHNLASTQRDIGNYDEARQLYREAWELHEKIRPNSPPVQLLYNMGRLHLQVSELDEAEEHFRESLEYARKGGIPPGLFYNFIGLGDVALARGDFSASIDFYNDGFDIAKKVDAPPFRINASEKLYEAYKQEGNFEQALKYHELAKQESDSLNEAQQDKQLALAETELGLRQQQQINQLLQEKQEQQEARIVTQNWLIGGSVLTTLLILIFAIMLYRSNRERDRINKELKELNQVKDKMMGIIAHDLRSPMASMQGIFYLLKDEDLKVDEIREIASTLEVSVRQNINMMDNLLSWANNQMEGLEVDFEILSAHELVDKVLKSSSFQAEHKSLTLLNQVDRDQTVKADPNLLQLIIRNLVNNAIKFSNEGDSVKVITEQENGSVIFKVKDTGIGIPKEDQEKLFSLQGHSRSGTNNEIGSGLGLQLCKEFVDKQGGNIYVESEEGQGSTFYVSLPKA